MSSDNLARVLIPDEVLPFLFNDGTTVENGLPRGSVCERIYRSDPLQGYYAVFRGPELSPVAEGAEIPEWKVKWVSECDEPWNAKGSMTHGSRDENMGRREIHFTYPVFSWLFIDGVEVWSDLSDDTVLLSWFDMPERRAIGLEIASETFDEAPQKGVVLDIEGRELWGANLPDSNRSDPKLSEYTR